MQMTRNLRCRQARQEACQSGHQGQVPLRRHCPRLNLFWSVMSKLTGRDPRPLATPRQQPQVGAGALRRKKKRQPKRNPPTDDDALLRSMIESVTRERDELKSLAQTDVLTRESALARKGMVCPEDHPVSVSVITNATSNCCFRCSSVPHLGEVWGCCIPCDSMICGSCVETFAGGHHCHCHDSGAV